MTGSVPGLRALTFAVAAAALVITLAPRSASAADPAGAVVRAAESHLGARYRWGSTGPTTFDCSGLVYRAFSQAGLGSRLHSLHSATGLFAYFSAHRLVSRGSQQVGDLVIWGRGSHVGIYIGHGRAISALTNGVRIHAVGAVLTPFTGYIHMHLSTAPHVVLKRHTTRQVTGHAASALALRSAPGTNGHRLAVLRSGTTLTIQGTHRAAHGRTWLHVRVASGHTGWVAGWHTRA